MKSLFPALAVLAGACTAACGPAPETGAPDPTTEDPLKTRAELSRFLATSSYDDTMAFLRAVERRSPYVKVGSFGRSAAGRPLPLVIVSREQAFTPEAARASGRPVLLVQSGIHAGEIDGKDATLMMLRDLAQGADATLLDAGTILFVPIYNVDGHERVSPFNRPNQDGPREGMGFRTTANGLDLNRDHLKLDSVEARALLKLVADWSPHLHVDNHVTNGVDHAWVLTWAHVGAPQLADESSAWLDATVAAVSQSVSTAGFPNGPYVSLKDRSDPGRGFTSWVGSPRLSNGYFALRGVPSILVETHAHKPYEQRVRANRAFLDALVKRIAEDPGALVAAVENGWERTVELGRTDAPPSRVALVYEEDPAAQSIAWPAYEWYFDDSRLFGKVLRFRRGEVREVEVPWFHRSRVATDVERPRGYLVLPGWPQITSRLLAHGLRVRCLAKESTVAAETMRLSDAEFAGRSYQGRTSASARVVRAVEKRTMPPGTLWVPADQPAFEVAVQLLEPEGKDSLFSWGVISSVVETKEYIELGRLSEFADEALRSDPAAREAWEAALSDPSFSNDQRSRYLWWYRRTPHWNEQAGLMPVFRVMHPPDFAISELADTP